MNKKKSGHSYKSVTKFKLRTFGPSGKKRNDAVASFESFKVQKTKAPIVIKPVVRKIGRNYIEMAHLSDFEPEAFCVPASVKRYEVSQHVLRIAKLLKRAPFASIRRIGRDLTDI